MGLCLRNVSERLPARELLLDPFLALDDDEAELLGSPKNPIRKPFRMEESTMVAAEPERCTDMTITGTMNPDDDAIFLKVQISDKNGIVPPCLQIRKNRACGRFIYLIGVEISNIECLLARC